MSQDQISPPSVDEFGAFRTPSGRVWNLVATPLSSDGAGTNDQGCVALAHHQNGTVALADTKVDLADQRPLVFLPKEWHDFIDAVRAGRV